MNRWNSLSIPIDPFISHMRIAYEEGIRNQTESYWRERIVNECIQTIKDMPWSEENWLAVDDRIDIINALQALLEETKSD